MKRGAGWGLVPVIALLAAGLIVAVTFVALRSLVAEDRRRALDDAVREATLLVRGVIGPNLKHLANGSRVRLDHQLASASSYIDAIAIIDRSGRVLFSYGPPAALRRPPADHQIRAARRGEPVVTQPNPKMKIVEVFLPVRAAGGPERVARVVMSHDAIVANTMTRDHTLALLLGDLALVLSTVVGLLLCFYRMVLSLRHQAAHNVHQALHDDLTGLPNRGLFRDRTEQAIARARREGRRVAVMIMDLDRFKEVNDTLGHHHGDLLLQEMGERLRSLLREVDTIARFGGDEFAVLLDNVGPIEAAEAVADKIRAEVSRPLVVGDLEMSVDASIGIALYPSHATDFYRLLQRADVAMYAAKSRGTGCETYAEDRDDHSPDRLALAHALKGAIGADELTLHYQPKVDMKTAEAGSLEALVRWQRPGIGLVPPDEFIAVAENAGLMGTLTSWVLNAALRQVRLWHAQGLDITVAVNISVRNLADAGLPEVVAALLTRYGVPATSLELEITESAIMSDPSASIEALRQLRALGCKLTIDDFGTGHSSLSYLQRLPVTALKIDKAFVANMLAGGGELTIVRSTIDLGRSLGLEVVAEGVEDPQTWRALLELGCPYAQGYITGRSMPAEDVPWLLNLVKSPSLC